MKATRSFLIWSSALTAAAVVGGTWMSRLSAAAAGRPDAGILFGCAIAALLVVSTVILLPFTKDRLASLVRGVVGGMTLGSLALVGLRVTPEPLYLLAGFSIFLATTLVALFTDLDSHVPGKTLFAVSMGQLLLFLIVF